MCLLDPIEPMNSVIDMFKSAPLLLFVRASNVMLSILIAKSFRVKDGFPPFDSTKVSSIDRMQESPSIDSCGVFAGDFMGVDDSWAYGYRTSTTPLTKAKVQSLFDTFEVIRFHERDEQALTSLGKMKHWHTYSVVAIKRRST